MEFSDAFLRTLNYTSKFGRPMRKASIREYSQAGNAWIEWRWAKRCEQFFDSKNRKRQLGGYPAVWGDFGIFPRYFLYQFGMIFVVGVWNENRLLGKLQSPRLWRPDRKPSRCHSTWWCRNKRSRSIRFFVSRFFCFAFCTFQDETGGNSSWIVKNWNVLSLLRCIKFSRRVQLEWVYSALWPLAVQLTELNSGKFWGNDLGTVRWVFWQESYFFLSGHGTEQNPKGPRSTGGEMWRLWTPFGFSCWDLLSDEGTNPTESPFPRVKYRTPMWLSVGVVSKVAVIEKAWKSHMVQFWPFGRCFQVNLSFDVICLKMGGFQASTQNIPKQTLVFPFLPSIFHPFDLP